MSRRRFRCEKCGKYVTISGVTCLDIVRCPMCAREVLVPEDSVEISETGKRRIYRPKTPCEKRKGKKWKN